jgi:enediyne biosynthesis protein E4
MENLQILQKRLETRSFGLSAILEDFNNDGLIDIYQANDYLEPDYLYINKGNNKFVEQHQKYFRHCSYSSMGSDYADLNNDGFSDLITTDMLPEGNTRQKQLRLGNNYDHFDKAVKYGFGHQYAKNVVQLNNGNGSYSDISYYAGMAFTDWSWATLINDFDNDGLKDVYIANGYMRDITDMDYVKFHMDSIQKELLKVKSNDEVISILTKIPSVKIKKGYFKNYGDLRFKREHKESGLDQFAWSFGAAYGDLDNDGDVEIIVNNSNDFAFIYKNNSIENKLGNAVRLQLVGPEKNINAIGSKIEVACPDGLKSFQILSPMKGYLSSRDLTQVIGIGKNTEASVKIIWPDGKESVLAKVAAGTVQKIQYPLMANIIPKPKNEMQFFKDYTALINDINFEHTENDYIDFKLEPLLHRKFSQLGPSIAVGDINGDALDDIVIGGAKDRSARIFIQAKNKFEELKADALIADKTFEDGKVKLFDIDNDKDLDLIISSGGNDYPRDISKYPLRIYLNNGLGIFTKWNKLDYKVSAVALAMTDYNKDGQVDIFVGGITMPGAYGAVPSSYVLSISDKNIVEQKIFTNNKLGMISDASWIDIDGDSWLDLVLVGEWMPITIYYNKNGILSSEPFTIINSSGWWNTIKAADLDGDGDLDLVAGNIGMNTRYIGDVAHPVTMISNDFDGNGSQESIINTFIKEQSYPIHIRDYMLDQMPFLRKKFLRYATYATAKLEDIFSAEQLAKAQSFKATQMNSCIYLNNGNSNFTEIILPPQAQLFPINSIIINDFDDDKKLDLLLAGNNYATEVETGRCDAGVGLFCKGQGNGKFTAIPTTASTCYIPGDTRCIEPIKIGDKTYYLVGKNKDMLQLIGK